MDETGNENQWKLFWIAVSFEAKFASHDFFPAGASLFWSQGLRKGISFPEKPQELLGHWQNEASKVDLSEFLFLYSLWMATGWTSAHWQG